MSSLPNVEQSYTAELVRKGIHLSSLSIPIAYYFIPQSTALSILVPLTVLFGLGDIARVSSPAMANFIHTYFGWLLRSHELQHESKSLTGATYVLLSASLCVWMFPKVIFITAFAILIVSDTAAALVGRKYGKTRFLTKSLEGSTAFLLSALFVVALAPKILNVPLEWLVGAIGAIVGTTVEASPLPLDDNLSLPLSIGAVMWVLYAVMLPNVDVHALDALR